MPARLLPLVVALGLVTTGCSGSEDPAAAPSATEVGTPLADLETSELTVVRGSFCDRVAAPAVEAAIGGEPATSRAHDNGERLELGDGRDVVHEFGCDYRAEDGTSARAWVFAPPVPPGRATQLVEAAVAPRGCRPDPRAPAFGRPSVALVCSGDGGVEASYRGLFGDAWLTCSVEVPSATADEGDLLGRAGRWCAAVLAAAGA